jgi:adenylate cyclase
MTPVLRFEQTNGTQRFRLSPGARLIVGRAPTSDVVIADPSVSRRHAELSAEGTSVSMRDLDSANGTLVNGVKSPASPIAAGDIVTFGAVPFKAVVEEVQAAAQEDVPAGVAVRALTVPISQANERDGRTLARLLGLAAGLGGDAALEGLLDGVAELAFDHVDADRVALLLIEGDGMVPAAGRSRVGQQIPSVPRAIADRAIGERVAVITESAMDDARFQSGSVKLQQVRGALCVPLFAPGGEILGVLYADTITRPVAFSEAEARALQAFAGLAAVVIGRARSAEEARRAHAIRESFERFFAPSVAATIANAPERAALGGARLPVAVLFGDIRGFTRLAESANPEELAGLLGEYFAGMVDAVFEHQGTLDKFTGDGLMAVWGAPFPQDDAADRALAAAREMRDELGRLNDGRRSRNKPPIEAGFGLSYGTVFAGNIGSERRLEYTVVGDAVNLAARLCEMAGPGEVLIDEVLASQLSVPPGLEPVAPLAIRGRGALVRAFRLAP